MKPAALFWSLHVRCNPRGYRDNPSAPLSLRFLHPAFCVSFDLVLSLGMTAGVNFGIMWNVICDILRGDQGWLQTHLAY